ncbi:MAG: S26 family signal peptidase [Spirochaetia bacterium]|nr:S26 family signal peptidase [Spirochaetia bacterium]
MNKNEHLQSIENIFAWRSFFLERKWFQTAVMNILFILCYSYFLFFIFSSNQPWSYYLIFFLTISATLYNKIFSKQGNTDNYKVNFLYNLKNKNEIFHYVQIFLFTILCAILTLSHIKYFIIQPYTVNQKSMLPGIKPGEIILVEKISMGLITNYYVNQNSISRISYPWRRPIQPGDVIIFQKPFTFYKSDDFIVNKSKPNDILIKRVERIEDNKYCVYGDNKENSIDSRVFGCVPENKIIGRYLFKMTRNNS